MLGFPIFLSFFLAACFDYVLHELLHHQDKLTLIVDKGFQQSTGFFLIAQIG
jgi:hypothetical protein